MIGEHQHRSVLQIYIYAEYNDAKLGARKRGWQLLLSWSLSDHPYKEWSKLKWSRHSREANPNKVKIANMISVEFPFHPSLSCLNPNLCASNDEDWRCPFAAEIVALSSADGIKWLSVLQPAAFLHSELTRQWGCQLAKVWNWLWVIWKSEKGLGSRFKAFVMNCKRRHVCRFLGRRVLAISQRRGSTLTDRKFLKNSSPPRSWLGHFPSRLCPFSLPIPLDWPAHSEKLFLLYRCSTNFMGLLLGRLRYVDFLHFRHEYFYNINHNMRIYNIFQ